MISDFDFSIAHLEDTFKANAFWRDKVKDLYGNHDLNRKHEEEIIELCPNLARLFERKHSLLREELRLFNLDRWDKFDGNPIFYGYVPKTSTVFRIIQRKPEDQTNQLSAWIEKSSSDFKEIKKYNPSITYELVISLELNNCTYHYALLIIYFWISRRRSKDDAQHLIKRVYDEKIRGRNSLD
ncbi:hypothetical protein [Pantoea agglomerans]|jgi:hypothetical protein|uniref:hypothetical protein n=1 Tax=Enterobacter agglomerans TaxID=549 RepID=UPI0034CE923F